MPLESQTRIARNVMIDKDKDIKLESLRTSSSGYTTTTKGRSDIYNEVISLGLKLNEIRLELGEQEFEHLWRILERVNLKKINLKKFL